VYSTAVHIWSELVATSLAFHYNHCILSNNHKKNSHYSPSHANSKELVKFTQASALTEFALP